MGSSSAPDEKMDMGVHSAAGIVKPEGVADREGPQSSSDPHAQNGANAANTAGARLKRVIRKPRRVAIECCPVSPLAKKEVRGLHSRCAIWIQARDMSQTQTFPAVLVC